MVTKNRQVKTGSDLKQSGMKIEVVISGTVNGKSVKKGEIISCSASEARRYFSMNKKMFKIIVD